ncbi:MAG: type II toxin-antitoxin system VapC family toxin [Caulobacteraceae bacterium]
MLAADTNLIVRFLVDDHPSQSAKARAAIESGEEIWVSNTVVLEAEWVLRGAYGHAKGLVLDALSKFVRLPVVRTEEPGRLAKAFDWAGRGLDFADALHLVAAEGCEAFLTFDDRLRRRASRLDAVPVRSPG